MCGGTDRSKIVKSRANKSACASAIFIFHSPCAQLVGQLFERRALCFNDDLEPLDPVGLAALIQGLFELPLVRVREELEPRHGGSP